MKSSHFRTSTPNAASSSQKKQTTPKTVTSGKVHIPSPRMHSFEDAKIQAGKKATGVRPGRGVDVSDGEQHSQEEPSATIEKEPKTSKSGNSVHSGPNKNITDSVKDGPFSNQTTDNSNAKSGPKMKHTSKKRRYWDFRDELSTDDGMLLKGPRLIIPGELQEEYLSHLHEGHLSASKVQENAKQHITGLESMQTLKITPSDARNVSKGLRYPRSPSSFMTSQRVLGGNLVLIILPSMATHMF